MSGTPLSNASLTGATSISGSVNIAAGTQISGLYKRHVGLGLVDNTSDMDKPVSNAVRAEIAAIKGDAVVLASKPALDTLAELAAASIVDLSSSYIIVGNNIDKPGKVRMSGDVTIKNDGETTISNGAVTAIKIDASAVITDKLSSKAVTLAKFQDVSAGKIIIGNVSNRPTLVSMSGAVTISNTGVTTISDNAVDTQQIAANAVVENKILNGAVTWPKIDSNVTSAFSRKIDFLNLSNTPLPTGNVATPGKLVYDTYNNRLYICITAEDNTDPSNPISAVWKYSDQFH